VQQFYLKLFTHNGAKNSRLFAYDLRERRHYLTTPEKACKQRDFNRIEAEGIPQDALESSLAGFESKAATALREVIESHAVTGESWLWVLNWMALMAARNPIVRNQLQSVLLETFHAALDEAVAPPEGWAKLREGIEREGVTLPDASRNYAGFREFVSNRKSCALDGACLHLTIASGWPQAMPQALWPDPKCCR
jgi:hypothetical protein